VALGLGSDSARVNEVAKLCRAVVRGDGRKRSSEGFASGVGESRRRASGWSSDAEQEPHSRPFGDLATLQEVASKRVRLSLCAMG